MERFKLISIVIAILYLFPSGLTAMETKNIIDMHCHIAGIGAGESGCFVSGKLRKSWKYKIYLKAFGVTGKELLKEGDGLVLKRLSEGIEESRYISSVVVLALDGVVGESGELDREQTEIYIPNEFVAAEVKKYPNLLFGASINPYRKDAIQLLEKAVLDGAVLIKWLPPIQNIDPADERLIPFYSRMKELGLPLLTHTGEERSFTRSNHALGDPDRLRLPLSLGVTVIAAHSACNGRSQGLSNYERFLKLCGEYPNLYGDISALTQLNRLGHLSRLLKQTGLEGRLLYGTDMPLINTALVTSFAFPLRVSFSRMRAISRIDNPWDRDVELKKALGVPEKIFTSAAGLLKVRK